MSIALRAAVSRGALVVATGFGSGYSPVAPGTAGSLVGLLLFWPLAHRPPAQVLAATAIVTFLGVLAAHRVARASAARTPASWWWTRWPGSGSPCCSCRSPWAPPIAGFLLFRLMDVLKPWPARDLEHLPGGWGIMADDLMAGVYANLLLRAGLTVWAVT